MSSALTAAIGSACKNLSKKKNGEDTYVRSHKSKEDESFEDLHSKFIDLKLIVGVRHFSIPLPEWWKRIEEIGYGERLEILESFMNDWPRFWAAFFDDPACDEKVARETILLRNKLRNKITRARTDLGKSEIEEYDFMKEAAH